MEANELIQWLRAEAREGDRVIISEMGDYLYLQPADPSRGGAGIYLGDWGREDD